MNKLWLLRPKPQSNTLDSPWFTIYDKNHGFIIRATTESMARTIAMSEAEGEGSLAWTPAYSTCVPLTDEGPVEIVMSDFHAG